MLLREYILREAENLLPELVEIRRHVHRNPELSYAEYETAAFISSRLDAMGIEHRTGIAGTGIVGFIRGEGAGSGLTIGLRADMDALPVTEAPGAEYRSLNEGVMHACGHDAHIAMLLGSAEIIKKPAERICRDSSSCLSARRGKGPRGSKNDDRNRYFREL